MPDTECKAWRGSTPKCEFCGKTALPRFVDAKTRHGPWALMCMTCYKIQGMPIGQEYETKADGTFPKVRDLHRN